MQVLAVDAGRSATKAVYGGKQYSFPSVIGDAAESNWLEGNGVLHVTAGKQAYTARVGRAAILTSETQHQEFATNRQKSDLLLLVAQAAYTAKVCGDVLLVVGAPVAYYNRAAKDYKTWLSGPLVVNDVRIHVQDVLVVPEPAGAYYGELLADKRIWKEGHVAVLDVGRLTTDAVVFDGGRYAANLSFSCELGTEQVHQVLHDRILSDLGINLRPHVVEDVICSDRLVTPQKTHNYKRVIRAAADTVFESIAAQLRTKWARLAGFDEMLAVGGGSLLFAQQLKAMYPDCRFAGGPEFTNVAGFFVYGQEKLAGH